MYIHQLGKWPKFTWQQDTVIEKLLEVKFAQGKLLGKMSNLGFQVRSQAVLKILTKDIIESSEIEGEHLNPDQVRSSIARHLNIDAGGLVSSTRDVDGIVEMLIDATQNYRAPLTEQRLFDWQAGLFPTGLSGLSIVDIGYWRQDLNGPMQVVSGLSGRERVHFEAPPANKVSKLMQQFLLWFNQDQSCDLIIKAAIAHLWFITIHPFDDGNGRIARALSDLILARSEDLKDRFYSMSTQIKIYRKEYYQVLERTQKGNLDITLWLVWFLKCLLGAIESSEQILGSILVKAKFWEKHFQTQFNPRQERMINALFNEFKGKLTTTKWAKITKVSHDTAARDIQDLILKEVIEQGPGQGKNTHFILKDFDLPKVD